MDVLLICNFWHFEFEKQSSRYRTMADVLATNPEFNVEVVSSSFRHQTKTQRDLAYVSGIHARYKVTLLYEPDYKNNISLRRLYSHHHFAKEVLKYLKKRRNPDVIICSVPSLAVGSVVSEYACHQGIRLIVDIQDLWPEAFKMAVNIPVVSSILFAPMVIQANRVYSRADVIMAVSETYVKRGLHSNRKATGFPLYIGTDPELVARSVKGIIVKKPQSEFWIGYAGALGYSYDICSIIDAIHELNGKGINNIVFKVMGEGVLSEKFRRYAEEKCVKCDFTGFLNYGTMMATLMKCDLAVNPIVGNSVSSIINKVSDYAMAGIPVINTQNSVEYRNLLEEYECGINCKNGDSISIANGIMQLYNNEGLRLEMRKNAQKMATERFDRQKTYPAIAKLIYSKEYSLL